MRPVRLTGDGEITDGMVAAYLAKYATKSTEATGHLSRRLDANRQRGSTMDSKTPIEQLAAQGFIALVPTPRPEPPVPTTATGIGRRWYSGAGGRGHARLRALETKMLIAMREIRSVKDGKYRRILPEWVDEYIARRVEESERAA